MNRLLVVFLVLVSVLQAGRAVAGIVGSPHDIAAQKYTVMGLEEKKRNVCNFCHVPHKAKGARLWAVTPPSLKGWGEVGQLCYSCHDGVAIVSPHVDASNTAFNPMSHGLDLHNLPDGDDASNSELPYTDSAKDEGMECSTCHNPHDNTNRPFLRKPITEICVSCHKNRENSGYALNNAEGTHPVHKLPKDEVEGPSPIFLDDDFKVLFPQEYPNEDGKYMEGIHWNLGGHLSDGETGTMECISCHGVHGREEVGPLDEKLLSVDPVKKNADNFCEGCHKGKRGDDYAEPPFPNPGGTELARTYHPADNDIGNGDGELVEISRPEGWTFGEGGEVLCSTCHKAHGALENSPILRPMQKSDTFCEECHNVEFSHHPSGESTGGIANVDSGKPHADTREVILPPDFPAGITYGDPVGGKIYCSSCHKAHNSSCIPILVTDCGYDGSSCDICTQCHPKFNPTWQTDDNFKATHFMGDPTLDVIDKVTITGTVFGTQRGYFDLYPPEKTDEWPESGQLSRYGGANNMSITCCSCHSFGVGGITAGDADQAPYEGPILAPEYQPGDLTSGLLARAGKYKEWLESDVEPQDIGGERGTVERVETYLCTGCHGLTPNSRPLGGEGLTHPLMDADGSDIQPQPPVSLTFNRHINCESCHSAHESDSRGGFFILRDVGTGFSSITGASVLPDPYTVKQRSDIEFAPLCQKCHIGY